MLKGTRHQESWGALLNGKLHRASFFSEDGADRPANFQVVCGNRREGVFVPEK